MRNLFMILCASLTLMLVVGCNNEDYQEPVSTLTIVEANLNVAAIGGEASVTFQAEGTVAVEMKSDWCLLKEVEANKILLRVLPNYGYSSRTTQLVISDGNETKKFTVNQEGAVLAYEDDDWVLRATNVASELSVQLYGSFDCTVHIPERAKEWLSFQKDADGKGGKFVLAANTTNDIRGAIVRVVSGERQFTYQVLQGDAENYVGTWSGQFTDGSYTYSLSDITIAKDENGNYVLSNLFTPVNSSFSSFQIKGTAAGSEIVFEAGQYLGTDGTNYYAFNVISADSQFVEDSSGTISLGPVILSNGRVAIGFIGVKETDPLGAALMAYTDEYLDEAYSYKAILNCILYK